MKKYSVLNRGKYSVKVMHIDTACHGWDFRIYDKKTRLVEYAPTSYTSKKWMLEELDGMLEALEYVPKVERFYDSTSSFLAYNRPAKRRFAMKRGHIYKTYK